MQTRKKKINSQRLVAANLRIPLDKKKKNERMRGKNVLCNAEILSSVGYFTRIEFTVFKWAQGTIYKLQASNTSDEICNGKIFVVEQFIKYSRTSSSWIKAMGILFFSLLSTHSQLHSLKRCPVPHFSQWRMLRDCG